MKNIPKHAGDAKNWSFPHFKKCRKSGRHYFKCTVYSSTSSLYKVKNKNKLNPHPTFLPLIVEFCRQNLGSSSSLQALHGKIRTSTPIAHMSENDHLKISIHNQLKFIKFHKNTCEQPINAFMGAFLQSLIQEAAAFSAYVLAEKNEF